MPYIPSTPPISIMRLSQMPITHPTSTSMPSNTSIYPRPGQTHAVPCSISAKSINVAYSKNEAASPPNKSPQPLTRLQHLLPYSSVILSSPGSTNATPKSLTTATSAARPPSSTPAGVRPPAVSWRASTRVKTCAAWIRSAGPVSATPNGATRCKRLLWNRSGAPV